MYPSFGSESRMCTILIHTANSKSPKDGFIFGFVSDILSCGIQSSLFRICTISDYQSINHTSNYCTIIEPYLQQYLCQETAADHEKSVTNFNWNYSCPLTAIKCFFGTKSTLNEWKGGGGGRVGTLWRIVIFSNKMLHSFKLMTMIQSVFLCGITCKNWKESKL